MVSTDETITASSKNTKRQPTAQDDAITSQPDVDTAAGEVSELEKRKAQDGVAKFSRLGWKRLTILLMVTAIALGTLSLPAAFATLGMVLGVILTIVSGLLAIFAGLLVGQTKLKYPEIHDYADVGRVLFGKVGYEIFHFMCILQLLFLAGSHCLTGTTALKVITAKDVCSVYFGLASAAALFIISLPPSFAEVAILGYVDFASIVITIGITIIATGIQHDPSNPLTASDWSAWPKPGITSTDAFIAVLNLVFAYSFTIAQFSFMDEMHTPGFQQVHLVSGSHPNHHVRPHRSSDLRLRGPRGPVPGTPVRRHHCQQSRLRRSHPRHLHQRRHPHRHGRTHDPRPHLRQQHHPLREHDQGLGHLDAHHHRHRHRRLVHRRGHPHLQRPRGAHLQPAELGLRTLLPRLDVVHAPARGQVEHSQEPASWGRELDSARDWAFPAYGWHICRHSQHC
uniref:Amino acid transporter transmembrane domain-containing protein n=1 Tax=Bionectria ochroleuca TaxID=29856 RepID=A0A8H7NQX8_BIOOC